MRTKLLAGMLAIVASCVAAGPAHARGKVRTYKADVLIGKSVNWLSSSTTFYGCGDPEAQLIFNANGSAGIQLRARDAKVVYDPRTKTVRTVFANTFQTSSFPLTGTWRRAASYQLQRAGSYDDCPPAAGNNPPPETSRCGTKTVTAKSNAVEGTFVRGKKNVVELLVGPKKGNDLFDGLCPDESLESAVLLVASSRGSFADIEDGEDRIVLKGTVRDQLKIGDLSPVGPSRRSGGGQADTDWSATLTLVK